MTETLLKSAFDVANKWGIFAAFCVFFVWRSDVRETAMRAEMDRDRTYVRETLVKTLQDNTAMLGRVSVAIAHLDSTPQ